MAAVPTSVLLQRLLAVQAAGAGWAIEIGIMPDEPDEIIMISDTGGLEPNPRYLLDFPKCQVMIRGVVSGYVAAHVQATAVKDLLLGVDSYDTLEGERVVSITQDGDLGFIGRDDDMRPLFSINFALIIEPEVAPESNRIAL